jgi:hypothetical protein
MAEKSYIIEVSDRSIEEGSEWSDWVTYVADETFTAEEADKVIENEYLWDKENLNRGLTEYRYRKVEA